MLLQPYPPHHLGQSHMAKDGVLQLAHRGPKSEHCLVAGCNGCLVCELGAAPSFPWHWLPTMAWQGTACNPGQVVWPAPLCGPHTGCTAWAVWSRSQSCEQPSPGGGSQYWPVKAGIPSYKRTCAGGNRGARVTRGEGCLHWTGAAGWPPSQCQWAAVQRRASPDDGGLYCPGIEGRRSCPLVWPGPPLLPSPCPWPPGPPSC